MTNKDKKHSIEETQKKILTPEPPQIKNPGSTKERTEKGGKKEDDKGRKGKHTAVHE